MPEDPDSGLGRRGLGVPTGTAPGFRDAINNCIPVLPGCRRKWDEAQYLRSQKISIEQLRDGRDATSALETCRIRPFDGTGDEPHGPSPAAVIWNFLAPDNYYCTNLMAPLTF
jgi:hypothetical protein